MLRAALPLLDVDRAVLASHDAAALADRRVATFTAGHPSPNRESVRAAERALALAAESRDRGGLLVLLSGGASAMLAAPVDGVHLDAKQETARRLMRAGAAIDELNCVRKHLSRIKGGRLAAAAGTTVTLALSDVHAPVADDPSVIGSGPTVADPTTFADAVAIVEKYRLELPAGVRDHLAAGLRGGRGGNGQGRRPSYRIIELHRRRQPPDGRRRRPPRRARSGLRRDRPGRGHHRRGEPGRRGIRHGGARRRIGAAASGLCAGIGRNDRHGSWQRFGRTESGVRARERRGVERRAGPERRHRQRRNGWHRRPDYSCGGPGRRDDNRAGPHPGPEPAGSARAERYLPILCGAPGPDCLGADRDQRRGSSRRASWPDGFGTISALCSELAG